MRKCLRCENEMAEDFSIIPSNGVSHIELIKNRDMMSNFKYAVCSKCGYTEIYMNDIQKVKKILQDDTILEPKEKIIVEDLKKYEKYLELEQIKRDIEAINFVSDFIVSSLKMFSIPVVAFMNSS